MTLSKRKRYLVALFVGFAAGMLYFIPYIRFSFYDQTLSIFGIDNTQMGTLGSVYGIVAIFGYFASGWLANKIQPKILFAISCFGTAAVTLWLAQFPNFTCQIIIYALFSVFTIATLWSPYTVIIRHLGGEKEQGKMYGFVDSSRNVFGAIAGFLFLWIFGLFVTEIAGYEAMLYIGIAFYVAFGILSLVVIPTFNDEENAEEIKEEGAKKVSVLDALKVPGVWLMGLFIFFFYNTIITATNYLGTYTTQMLSVPEGVSSGIAISRTYIVTIFAGLIAGYIADKVKSKGIFFAVLAFGLAATCVLIPMFAKQSVVAIVISVVLSLFAYMALATYWSVMEDCKIPMRYTAVASGIISLIAYLPDAYVTIVIGKWLDADPASGFSKMFIYMTICAVIAAVLALVIHFYSKKSPVEKTEAEKE